MTRRIVQIDEMPRISDKSLYALRDIVACSAKGRGVYLESDLADDLASALRELMERRDEPDPIAELEAMGGRLFGGHIPDQGNDVHWYLNGRGESAGNGASIADLRAAAARLLARVRGAK